MFGSVICFISWQWVFFPPFFLCFIIFLSKDRTVEAEVNIVQKWVCFFWQPVDTVGWVSFVTSWVWLCRYHCHLQCTPDLKFPQWWIAVTSCGLRSVPAPLAAVSSLRTSEGLSVCARFVAGVTEFSVLLTYPQTWGRECEPGPWELGFLSLLSLRSAPAKLCPVSEGGLRPERGSVLCSVVAHCFVLVRILGQEGFLSPSWSGGLLLLPLLQEQWLFAWALGWAGFLTISRRSVLISQTH